MKTATRPAFRALAVFALGLAGVMATPIPLNNASLEAGGSIWAIPNDFDGWTESGQTGKAPVAHTGGYSLWNCWGYGWNSLFQQSRYTVVSAGETITASVWAKTDANLGSGTASFNLSLKLGNDWAAFIQPGYQGGRDWTQLTTSYVTTVADIGKTVGISFGTDGGPGAGNPGYVYMDDPSLSTVTPQTATNWPTFSATASSISPGCPASNACDGDGGTAWASATHAKAFHSESLAFWMDASHPVNYIKIYPLTIGGSSVGIPVNFHVESASGASWNYVGSFSHVSRPVGGAPFIVRLPATLNTNGLRIVAEVLGNDLAGNYAFEVAEVSAGYDSSAGTPDQVLAAASASSVGSPGQEAANVIDGNFPTLWSSGTNAAASATEWIQFGFKGGGHSRVNYVKMRPHFSGRALGFPVDFAISYYDGSKWTTALINTGFPNPTADDWIVLPIAAVDAYQIKITATKLGTDGTSNAVGNYVFQLAEVGAGYDPGFNGLSLLGNSTYGLSAGSIDQVSASGTASSTVGTGWAASNATDGNLSTLWSSAGHGKTPGATEWIKFGFVGSGHASVNYLKILPRYSAALGRTLCFPVSFTVAYSPDNGVTWTTVATQSGYPMPTTDDWVVIPFPAVDAYQLKVTATTLGTDDSGNCYFQLAEIAAGYDADFLKVAALGNNVIGDKVEIRNVGSDAFITNAQLGNWVYDTRNPIVTPGAGNNIYAPSVVFTGSGWNIYFGGWDAVGAHDQLSMTTCPDNFLTFGSHSLLIANGEFSHVNNPCVVQTDTNQWKMICTVLLRNPVLNKPMAATSADGNTWTPSSGIASALINMNGYTDATNADWTTADVNGSNHFLYENGVYHMFFDDFVTKNNRVQYATSTDFKNFTYRGVALNEWKICNDVKKFSYGGQSNYLWAYHLNGNHVWYSTGTSIAAPSPSSVLFSNNGSADTYITSPCFVTDATRLYGSLYGAGAPSSLNQNRIFATWLQKKVVFTATSGTTIGTSGNQSYGPDRQQVATSAIQSVGTGRFSVYDTDGVSLLYVSPVLTLRKGDVWQYRGPGNAAEPAPPSYSSYDTWISGFPVGDTTAGGDPDGDGIPNLLEFVLNGNPGRADAASLDALSSGSYLVFSFDRRVDSIGATTQIFQYGYDLKSWTDIPLAAGPMVALGPPSGGLQSVIVTIPRNGAAKTFGRLKVILNQ